MAERLSTCAAQKKETGVNGISTPGFLRNSGREITLSA
jgi:hypothetical protein